MRRSKFVNHPEMVQALRKPGDVMLAELTALDCDMMHMAIGISGEAGELLDAVKKAVIYRKPIDRANVVEELGDLEFYLEALRQVLNISRAEVLAHNINKLSVRYHKQQYTNEQAIAREDKETKGNAT